MSYPGGYGGGYRPGFNYQNSGGQPPPGYQTQPQPFGNPFGAGVNPFFPPPMQAQFQPPAQQQQQPMYGLPPNSYGPGSSSSQAQSMGNYSRCENNLSYMQKTQDLQRRDTGHTQRSSVNIPTQSSTSQKPIDIDAILKDERLKNVLFSGISKATQKLEQSLKSQGESDNVSFLNEQRNSSSSQLFPSASSEGKPRSILKRNDEGGSSQSEKMSVLEKTLQLLKGKPNLGAGLESLIAEKKTGVNVTRQTAALGHLSSYSDDPEDEERHLYGGEKEREDKSASSGLPFWAVGAQSSEAAKRDTASTFDLKEKLYEEWRNKLNKPEPQNKALKAGDASQLQALISGQDGAKPGNQGLDSTVQNILQSIGFNFDLSKRMQELAKQKKREYDDQQTGIVDQQASFLQNAGDIEKMKANLFSSGSTNLDSLIKQARAETKSSKSDYDRHNDRSPSPGLRGRHVQRSQSPSRRRGSPYYSRSPERPSQRSWSPGGGDDRRQPERDHDQHYYGDSRRSRSGELRAATPPRGISRGESYGRAPRVSERYHDEPKDEYYYPDENEGVEQAPSVPFLISSRSQKRSENLSSGLLKTSKRRSLSRERKVENFTVMSRATDDDDSFTSSRRIIIPSKPDRVVVSRSKSPSYRGSRSPHHKPSYKRSASPISQQLHKDKRFKGGEDYDYKEKSSWSNDGYGMKITTFREKSPVYRDKSPAYQSPRNQYGDRDRYDERRESSYGRDLGYQNQSKGESNFKFRDVGYPDKKAYSPFLDFEEKKDFRRLASPGREGSKKGNNRSPYQDRARSPHRDRSPNRDRARSPNRDRGRSPKRGRSPYQNIERSPNRVRGKSPHRERQRSPYQERARSPYRDRGRSPNRDRARSPFRDKARSPNDKNRDKARSPRRRSTDRERRRSTDRERSPGRRRSPNKRDISKTSRGYDKDKGFFRPDTSKYKLDNRKKNADAAKATPKVDLSKMSDSERKEHLHKMLLEKNTSAEDIKKMSPEARAKHLTMIAEKLDHQVLNKPQPTTVEVQAEAQIRSSLVAAIDQLSSLSVDARRQVLMKMSAMNAEERHTAMTNLSLRQSKIKVLKSQLDKLKKDQNELMRKSRRSGLGDKDPALVKNSKDQKQTQEEIDRLGKFDPDNPFAEIRISPPPSHAPKEKGDVKPPTKSQKSDSKVSGKSGSKVSEKSGSRASDKSDAKNTDAKKKVEQVKVEPEQKKNEAKQNSSQTSKESWKSVKDSNSGKLPDVSDPKKESSKVRSSSTKKDSKQKAKDQEPQSSQTVGSSSSKVYYSYVDGGNHFCKLCNAKCNRIAALFDHLHGRKHLTKIQNQKAPWKNLKDYKKPAAPRRVGQAQTRRIKGSEMLYPVVGFFCSLCEEFIPDLTEAANHLKSDSHYEKYMDFIKANPGYEKDQLLGRMSASEIQKTEANPTPPPDPPSVPPPKPPLPLTPPPPPPPSTSSKKKPESKSASQPPPPKPKKQLRASGKESKDDTDFDQDIALGFDDTTVEDMEIDDEDMDNARDEKTKVPKLLGKDHANVVKAHVTSTEGVKESKEDKNARDKPLSQFLSIGKDGQKAGSSTSLPMVLDLKAIPIPSADSTLPTGQPPLPPGPAPTAKSLQEIDAEEKRMMGIDVDAAEEKPLGAIPVPPPVVKPTTKKTETKTGAEPVKKKPKNLDTLFSKISSKMAAKLAVKESGSKLAAEAKPTEMEQQIWNEIQQKLEKEKMKLIKEKEKEERRAKRLQEASEQKKKRVYSSSSSDNSSDESDEEIKGTNDEQPSEVKMDVERSQSTEDQHGLGDSQSSSSLADMDSGPYASMPIYAAFTDAQEECNETNSNLAEIPIQPTTESAELWEEAQTPASEVVAPNAVQDSADSSVIEAVNNDVIDKQTEVVNEALPEETMVLGEGMVVLSEVHEDVSNNPYENTDTNEQQIEQQPDESQDFEAASTTVESCETKAGLEPGAESSITSPTLKGTSDVTVVPTTVAEVDTSEDCRPTQSGGNEEANEPDKVSSHFNDSVNQIEQATEVDTSLDQADTSPGVQGRGRGKGRRGGRRGRQKATNQQPESEVGVQDVEESVEEPVPEQSPCRRGRSRRGRAASSGAARGRVTRSRGKQDAVEASLSADDINVEVLQATSEDGNNEAVEESVDDASAEDLVEQCQLQEAEDGTTEMPASEELIGVEEQDNTVLVEEQQFVNDNPEQQEHEGDSQELVEQALEEQETLVEPNLEQQEIIDYEVQQESGDADEHGQVLAELDSEPQEFQDEEAQQQQEYEDAEQQELEVQVEPEKQDLQGQEEPEQDMVEQELVGQNQDQQLVDEDADQQEFMDQAGEADDSQQDMVDQDSDQQPDLNEDLQEELQAEDAEEQVIYQDEEPDQEDFKDKSPEQEEMVYQVEQEDQDPDQQLMYEDPEQQLVYTDSDQVQLVDQDEVAAEGQVDEDSDATITDDAENITVVEAGDEPDGSEQGMLQQSVQEADHEMDPAMSGVVGTEDDTAQDVPLADVGDIMEESGLPTEGLNLGLEGENVTSLEFSMEDTEDTL